MKGLSSLRSRLSALPTQAQGALLKAALEAARETQSAAQAAAPVRTGALRQSIAARAADQGAVAAAAAPYAAIVEMGGFHRPAQPYLLPAFQASDYTARAARALREVLR